MIKLETKSKFFFAITAEIYEITECCGCKKLNFNIYERINPHLKDRIIFSYPNNSIREMPKWMTNLPIKYIKLFSEVYRSLNDNNITLPLIGLRTLLDMYMVDKIGDIGNLKKIRKTS